MEDLKSSHQLDLKHRHDQAIWSLLVRQGAPLLIPDEMWPPGAVETGPIVAARRR
jgi:hypothetical protein